MELNPYDIVGVSFWILFMVSVLMTVFLFAERQTVSVYWKLPLTVSSLLMLLTAVHYCSMKQLWIEQQNVVFIYRYVEWLIALPLLSAIYYFVLTVGRRHNCWLFKKLFFPPVMVLIVGYLSELEFLSMQVAVAFMMGIGLFAMYTLWFGAIAKAKRNLVNLASREACCALRLIMSAGWLLYPFVAVLEAYQHLGAFETNIAFNAVDLGVRSLFVIIVWYAAYKDSGLLHTE